MIKNWSLSIIAFGLLFFLFSFIKNDTNTTPNKDFVVVLDAGHGGQDPGNLGNGYLEKDIALSIVLHAGAILEKSSGIKVIYTRNDDTFVDLYKRGEIANKANADLFVSVHCDSHSSSAYGAGSFVLGLHANKQNFEVAKKENSVIYLEDNYEQRYAEYDINSPEAVIGWTIMQEEFLEQSMQFAGLLQDNFTHKLQRKDRKVKQAGFIVLHQTFMPSVLIEAGFLTNKSEGAYLNSKKGQQEMGKAIAEAVIAYKNGVQASSIDLEVADVVNIPETPKEKKEVVQEKVEVAPKKEVPAITKTVTKPQPVVKSKESIKKETPTKTVDVGKVIFKVQIMASAKSLSLIPQNFNGLTTLSKEPYKNMTRYMYGNTSSYTEAKKLRSTAEAKGFTGAYIVAYKDGGRITIYEALKLISRQ